MKRIVVGTVKQVLWAALYVSVGGMIVGISGMVMVLDNRPDLRVWHEADLDEEFSVGSEVATFADYLALEERLFAQLQEEVYDKVEPAEKRQLNRYHRRGLSDPARWKTNWNRSFEMPRESPSAGVLLIHGMSDSPYSMRSLAERVHREGAFAVGMRVPGHGTAPVGLVDVEWQDMAAAVRIAARHTNEKAMGAPFLIIGYSNGGALAVNYALEALEDDALPVPARIVLLSPEIGITKLAALAVWQERLGHLLGLEKLAWNSILPEYDPFKYGSFALNAGKQAHLITDAIQTRITKLSSGDALGRFPPTLAFQSVVDATVEAPVLVSGLFDRLPAGGHEIVLFDVNRYTEIEPIMKSDPARWIDTMLKNHEHEFTIAAVVNESDETERVTIHRKRPGGEIEVEARLGMRWPHDIYSLSHVALPFPPDDPVYGGPNAGESPGIQLGNIALRGEKGVLQVSGTDMLRLRWNPFHDYIAQRLVGVMRDAESSIPPMSNLGHARVSGELGAIHPPLGEVVGHLICRALPF
jgi:alpha-beta hydrolase superfamily lysophospholipase